MKKISKILSIVMTVAMVFSTASFTFVFADDTAGNEPVTAAVKTAGLDNFVKTAEYKGFTDVKESSWYYDSVKKAYELGLVKGVSDTAFNPAGSLTLAEAVTLASRINSIYYANNYEFKQGSVWYQVYVDYAAANGILKSATQYADYNKAATRTEFAEIMAASLPDSALPEINTVKRIPDVDSSNKAYNSILKLYKAGIVKGSDEAGNFKPESNITRAEVSTIVVRMSSASERVSVTIDEENSTGYDNLISTIVVEMGRGWENSPESYGLSPIYSYSGMDQYLGFVKKDIDGDGVEELLIGEIAHDGMPATFYDIFTINSEGKTVHLFSGGERNRMYLYPDGVLVNEGSNGADDSFTKAYKIKDGKLAEINLAVDTSKYMNVELELFNKHVQVANPWVDTTAEGLKASLGYEFKLPEGSTNAVYRMNTSVKMGEVDFTYDNMKYTARIQATSALTDISGVYANWDVVDDCNVNGAAGKSMRSLGKDETIDVIYWYDAKKGLSYSLMTKAKDLDGFDIEAIAEMMYTPA